MHFDLATLYSLAIGTLLLGAGMTLWEGQARPQRRRELRILAAGFATLAIGCAISMGRDGWLGASAPALSNLTIVSGYLLILNGVALLGGRERRVISICILAALALAWALAGGRWQPQMWSYVGGLPIAIASGATAWEMLRTDEFRFLRSRRMVVAVTSVHCLLYAARAFVLPLLDALYGPTIVSVVGKITIYEGVLYSVALPMALLSLVREESHDQLLEASRTDFLTGLGNRRWFFEAGGPMIQTADALKPVSLLAFDLDHFKAINDHYGHATGDEVLKAFAHISRATLGSGAILARIGGEEFAALLPGCDSIRAKEIGQAVARRFAETSIHSNGARVTATVSVGLAELRSEKTSLAGLLSAADGALYLAKEHGRNRIALARPGALAEVA